MPLKSEIQIRDPFIHVENDTYYLYGSTDHDIWQGGTGFDMYKSRDLEHFDGPFPIFRAPEGFWGTKNFWAPELHVYQGKYYLFATFNAHGASRGTQILAAESLEGPFLPISAGPATPRDWGCLDGTLYVENGAPYMVFCHEWEQIQNGSICAVLLSGDLTRAVGEPVLLFHASDAPWVTPFLPGCYVTDGPFLYQGQKGRLFMLWSSFHNGSYAIGAAWSDHGVLGPWHQNDAPIFCGDGGHGMLFKTLEGQLTLAIHTPNATPAERAVFLPAAETETGFCLL